MSALCGGLVVGLGAVVFPEVGYLAGAVAGAAAALLPFALEEFR